MTRSQPTEENLSPTLTATPIAVITGAGSGIGAATAIRFAREKWDLVFIGRRSEALVASESEVIKSLPQIDRLNPPAIHKISLDIAKSDADKRLSEWLDSHPLVAKRVSAVIHNAGIFERLGTMNSDSDSWQRIFETNLFAPIRMTRVFYPLLKLNRGSIVNVSSSLGLRPMADAAAYSASKSALNNWTQSFALEAAKDSVRVNAVCPGIVDTPIHDFHFSADKAETLKNLGPMQPLGRIGKPSEVAYMIWTLTGPGSEWTTGSIITVDGGISLL